MTGQSQGRSGRPAYIAVIGPGDPGDIIDGDLEAAREVGRLLAAHGAVLVCGGLGGVMDAACRAAHGHEPAGITVGFLPGGEHGRGSRYLSVEIPTGLGELRNGLVVGAAEAVIAVGGSWGTMTEISLAMKRGMPVFQIGGWTVAPTSAAAVPYQVADASAAVPAALSAVQQLRNAHESQGI